jgi:hypothetical protein
MSALPGDLCQDLRTILDEEDEAGLRDWAAAGFTALRREHHYQVPASLGGTHPAGAILPAGMSLISADAVDEDGLRPLMMLCGRMCPERTDGSMTRTSSASTPSTTGISIGPRTWWRLMT